ncbi:ShlB/FhaC/HecB family hemolysin secretion/activation protein [Serratia microhaemolytica]|uniref:ShlB/FhaC/HecB family hemolysin secretion/activation protein n=1 Tax=Serratia microhaemolytica TaxID=2675110 RepID=UPI0013923278|nr:ShlB/FhaC/HecB family hemolysin secretion/activation protein [Serratia microhaemolytica]
MLMLNRLSASGLACLFILLHTRSASAAPERLPEVERQQEILQQQRQQAIEKRLAPNTPEVNLAPAQLAVADDFPIEQPCFLIQQVELDGKTHFPSWLPLQRTADRALNRCLGGNGINMLMRKLQNQLIDKGYVTSRVLAPEQDLTTGQLKLILLPGTVTDIRLTEGSGRHIQLATTLPQGKKRLLDSKAIEQGVENLQRIPTVQANIDIIPGEQPGESELAVNWQQSKFWRLGLSLDDSGNRSTGKYQGAATLYLDNLLSLSDMLYLSLSYNLPQRAAYRSGNHTLSYSLPVGYWSFAITASENNYFQTVAGAVESYKYAGSSKNVQWQASRIVHRNARQKTTLSYDISGRLSRNYVNDTEVDVQRRQTTAWKIGISHRHQFDWGTLDAQLTHQRGTRWFGAQPAPEEYRGRATALSKVTQLNASLEVPFSLWQQAFQYQLQYRHQTTSTPLTPQDQFSIGGRWSVRGFDGESSLTADKGWLVRNDLLWKTPLPNTQLYLAADYGEVYGQGSEWLVGQHLAGGVVGVKGNVFRVNYDLFAGRPLSKPAGFQTSSSSLGFSLNWQF